MAFTNDICNNCIHKGICTIQDKLDDFVIRMNRAEYGGWPLSSWIDDIPKEVTLRLNCNRKQVNSGTLR